MKNFSRSSSDSKSRFGILATLFSIFLLQHTTNATIVLQSATQTLQFGSTLTASWFTFVDETNVAKLSVTLKADNVDASTWDNQGEMGYWMGIGFGQTVMLNSDIVLCLFKYTNNAAVDKFLCQDSNATVKYSQPVLDAKDNVDNEVTVFSMDGNKKASLQVTFERLLDTLDTDND